jgi:hypothetical protein
MTGAREHSGPQDAREAATVSSEDDANARRHRDVAPGDRQAVEAVAQKVLHGWLQNRHQTAMPLTVNLGRLAPAEALALMRFAAVAALAGGSARAPEAVRTWLKGVAAGSDLLAAYAAALDAPPSLDAALAGLDGADAALTAYVLALVAAREAGPAARTFADYVALHRGLPAATVRAATRRYQT